MKQISDFEITRVDKLGGDRYALMTLRRNDDTPVRGIMPGQFVQVEVPEAKGTLLRRPISVCDVDDNGNLVLLVRDAGDVTHRLVHAKAGMTINLVYPLGNGFVALPNLCRRVLLVGGGVGVAPLYYLARNLRNGGSDVHMLIGARTADDVLMARDFGAVCDVEVCTEDGSEGTRGLVTAGRWLSTAEVAKYDLIACCGPTPMMKAVAAIARKAGVKCLVSLENMMACGLGACLCCVEKMNDGHNVCVCTEGPVFDIDRLPW